MRYRIRREQVTRLRKERLAAGLVRELRKGSQAVQREAVTGDVLAANALGNQTRYAFDDAGFVGSVTTPLGRQFRVESRSDGSPLQVSNPAGRRLNFEYDRHGFVTGVGQDGQTICRLHYDVIRQLTEVTYYDGTATRLNYSNLRKLTSITNRLGHAEGYEYAATGEMVAVVDGNGHRTAFRYSQWDRPSAIRFADGTQELYDFDPAGRLQAIHGDSEQVVQIAYDGDGRPVVFRYGDGKTREFTYDGEGHLIAAVNEEVSVAFVYDEAGRVVAEDQGGQLIQYAYDKAGNLVALTYPDGDQVRFAYDADRRLTGVTDWNGGDHRYQYKPNDAGHTRTTPAGVHVDVTTSPSGLTTACVATGPREVSQPLFRQAWNYDVEDRLVQFTDAEFGVRTYQYDAEGQVLSVSPFGAAPAESFGYDPAGNRVNCNGAPVSFNAGNQLSAGSAEIPQCDGRGNMTQFMRPDGQWQLQFDLQNQLVVAAGPRGDCLSFTYDALGRRIGKRVQQGNRMRETRYVWAGEQMIAEVDIVGGQTKTQEYLYLPGGYVPLATRVNGAVYSYHCDHLGTPTRLTDGVGRVVWSAAYGAFGQAYLAETTIRNPLRAPGQYHDRETGLYYNRFRYYAPDLGRYLSRDPVGLLEGPNLYAYVGNNPINRSDPLGLWWKAALSVAAGVAAAAVVVLTAPVSLPALAIAAGAAALGVGVGLGVNKALNLKEFCLPCFLEAFGVGFLMGAGITALAIAAALTFPAWGTAIAVGGAVVGIGLMVNEHFGLVDLGPLGGAKSFDEMTPEEQNHSLGGLAGGLAGSLAMGKVAARFEQKGYPARTPESDAAAHTAAEAIDAAGIGGKKGKAVTAVTHEDGSVSVGVSGSPKDAAQVAAKTSEAGTMPANYNLGGDMANPSALKPASYANGKQIASTTCAETRAWQAAQNNPSPPTGQTTVWRGNGPNPYPVEPGASGMNPCPSCSHNAATIMGQPASGGQTAGTGPGAAAGAASQSPDSSQDD